MLENLIDPWPVRLLLVVAGLLGLTYPQWLPKVISRKEKQTKTTKQQPWEVPGARQKHFKLYEAACLLAGEEPAWPLPSQMTRDEYLSLCSDVQSDKLGDDLAYSYGWLEGEDGEEVYTLKIPRKVLRKYIKSMDRPVPEFLKKRFAS